MILYELINALSDIKLEKSNGKFAKTLFVNFTSNEETIDYLNSCTGAKYDSYVKRAHSGRRQFVEIAKRLYAQPDFDKFIEFLKGRITKVPIKEAVCKNITKLSSDVTTDNLFEKIALILYNLCGEQLGYEPIEKLSDIVIDSCSEGSSLKSEEKIGINHGDSKQDINESINNLFSLFKEISDKIAEYNYNFCLNTFTQEQLKKWRKGINELYQKFLKENINLRRYYLDNHELQETFECMIRLSNVMFIVDEVKFEGIVLISKEHAKGYEEHILKLKDKLSK